MTLSRPQLHLAEPGMHPLDYAIADFLHAKALKSPKTQTFYKLALTLYADHVGLHWPPTESSLNSFLAACTERGCKPGTVHAYFRALRCWLNWLFERRKLEDNPIRLVDAPRKPRQLPRAPRAMHVALLLTSLERAADGGEWRDIRDRALFGLIYAAGLRAGEAVTLRLDDLHVSRQIAIIRHTKSDRDRVVCFDAHTARELITWLQARPDVALPFVFVSRHRAYKGLWGALTADGLRRVLEVRCRRAGVPVMTPHQLRHAHASHFLRSRGDLLDLQKQLGHANLSTTQRYAEAEALGQDVRYTLHSPRANLGEIAANETPFSPADS